MILLEAKHVSKKFCLNLKKSILYGINDIVRAIFLKSSSPKLRQQEFWALNDINFSIKGGEILGVLGENGSGKTTLLRIINNIFPPDGGEIFVKGKVGGLIAVGAGFHPHMSGRENIFINGSLLGMSMQELKEKLEEIIAFSELGKFIDAPLATYSSGMKIRLGFSIAAHSSPDILLVDEALSVGDLNFRNKCFEKIMNMKSPHRAIVFVSHSLEQIRMMCTRVIILDKSKLVYDGETSEGISFYENMMIKKRAAHLDTASEWDSSIIDGVSAESELGEEFTFRFKVTCNEEISGDFIFNFGITSSLTHTPIIFNSSDVEALIKVNKLTKGQNIIAISLKALNLSAGSYGLNLAIRDRLTNTVLARFFLKDQFTIEATPNNLTRGLIHATCKWNIEARY